MEIKAEVWRGFDSKLADFRRFLHLLNQSPSQWLPQMVLANVSSPWIHTSCLDYRRQVMTLSVSSRPNISQAQYAATFVLVASVCCAKLSLVAFLHNLTPSALDRKLGLGIGLLVVVSGVTAIVTVAFQCHLPRPWDYVHQSCFNRV